MNSRLKNDIDGWDPITKIKVMIVDDSRPFREMLKKMIEIYPEFEVVSEAESAEEARKLIDIKRPDVLTLDIKMAGMDGITFLNTFVSKKSIPTIIVSVLDGGSVDSGPVFQALQAGAFDYINKPSFKNFYSMADDMHHKILEAYNSTITDKKQLFLMEGEIATCKVPTRITTVLGSCVAVCLFDKKLKVGSMCHYSLAKSGKFTSPPKDKENHYGHYAIKNCLKELEKLGSSTNNLEAHIIGGGNVMSSLQSFTVHTDNIEIAEQTLKKSKIRVVDQSVGGREGRKVVFITNTGAVEIIKIEKYENEHIITSSKRAARPTPSAHDFKKGKEAANALGAVGKTEEKKTKTVSRFAKQDKIKVMIVDDSKAMRSMLTKMINSNREMTVVKEAASAKDAREFMEQELPDVITLDIKMPEMDGVTFLKQFMRKKPVPTIMISIIDYTEAGPVFEALDHGAFDYIQKPSLEDIFTVSADLHQKIKVAHTSNYINKKRERKKMYTGKKEEKISTPLNDLKNHLLIIGASTGGPETLHDILTKLPANIPPTIIVQHMPGNFTRAFAERLNRICRFKVKEAENGDMLTPGSVIVARGGQHAKIIQLKNGDLALEINNDPSVHRRKPSIDYTFNSVPQKIRKNVLAILLSGIGVDGIDGLVKLKKDGGTTINEDESSSLAYNTLFSSQRKQAANETIPSHDMASAIAKYFSSIK